MVCDGHTSRLDLNFIEAARARKLSHLLQPCDQMFGVLKQRLGALRAEFALSNSQPTLQEFIKIAGEAWRDTMTAALAQNAFRTCGRLPFNCHAVDAHLADLKPQQAAKGPTALAVAEATLAVARSGSSSAGAGGAGRGPAGQRAGEQGAAGTGRQGWGGQQWRQQRGAPAQEPQQHQRQLRRHAVRAFARPFTAWRGHRRPLRHW